MSHLSIRGCPTQPNAYMRSDKLNIDRYILLFDSPLAWASWQCGCLTYYKPVNSRFREGLNRQIEKSIHIVDPKNWGKDIRHCSCCCSHMIQKAT